MKKEFVVIGLVFVAILVATALLSGTGVLTGFSGMFVRVLLGFATVFAAVQLVCRPDGAGTGSGI